MPDVGRRAFLLGAAGAVAACTSGRGTAGRPTAAEAPATTVDARSDPFTCGVASGDPLPDRVVLWTRAARATPLVWEVALDESFGTVAASGSVTALAEDDFTVRVDATGLAAATRYWYRFRVDGFEARGRTTTAPAAGAPVGSLRFGFGSCQNFEGGYYAAHRDVAASDLDLFVWLGDYIYEYAPVDGAVRAHTGGVCRSLAEYRARYALYRSDADLRAAHASCPWIVVWDDHEVENNYAAAGSAVGTRPDAFLAQRALAYRAWWEYMPTRLPRPAGPELRIYRDLAWGALARVFALDGRQYRSEQSCGGGSGAPCPEWAEPGRTMLGADQERWLLDALAASEATWNVVGNQVVLADVRFGGTILSFDQWDGYPAARERLLRGVVASGATNVVVLTGDIHLGAVADLRVDRASPVIATELVCTSLSSPANYPSSIESAIGSFPALRYLNARKRGWVRNVVTPDRWTAEFRVVDDVSERSSAVTTDATFVVTAGRTGAQRV